MPITKCIQLLKRSIGLDVESIGSCHIERAIKHRQAACQLADPRAYWDRVSADSVELQALIETVVVPETWFFRDAEAFAALAAFCQQRSQHAATAGALRLLSLPSSTGEEPYSMAMCLLDAGIAPDAFRIDALDVSGRALARAARGLYGKNSFRAKDASYRDRHFDPTPDGWQLNDQVRRQVHFRQANLLAADFYPGPELYDAIFCRNLLIYFDRPTQDRAVAILRSLLAPQGMLFVAPSETGLILDHDFVSTNTALAFAFRKSTAASPAAKARADRSARRSSAVGKAPAARPVLRAIAVVAPVPALQPPPVAVPVPDGLEQATQFANHGDLVAAAACCEQHLRQHGPSASVFHLMAVVRDASGNPSAAAEYYRKALYLDPNHHETLVHFALLADQQGDPSGAQVLRNRARRVEARGV